MGCCKRSAVTIKGQNETNYLILDSSKMKVHCWSTDSDTAGYQSLEVSTPLRAGPRSFPFNQNEMTPSHDNKILTISPACQAL